MSDNESIAELVNILEYADKIEAKLKAKDDEIERLTAVNKEVELALAISTINKEIAKNQKRLKRREIDTLIARIAELESAAIVERDSINARFDQNVELIKADEKQRMKIERLTARVAELEAALAAKL